MELGFRLGLQFCGILTVLAKLWKSGVYFWDILTHDHAYICLKLIS